MNTEVKCSIIEVASNEPLYQIEVHNSLIPAYIVKKHDGLIPYIHNFMPSNLAEAMVKLLADTSNDGLVLAKDILSRSPSRQRVDRSVVPERCRGPQCNQRSASSLVAQFRTATYDEVE